MKTTPTTPQTTPQTTGETRMDKGNHAYHASARTYAQTHHAGAFHAHKNALARMCIWRGYRGLSHIKELQSFCRGKGVVFSVSGVVFRKG